MRPACLIVAASRPDHELEPKRIFKRGKAMAALEEIVEKARALSSNDKQKLREALDQQLEARHCTAIHEAAHAVLSYLLESACCIS